MSKVTIRMANNFNPATSNKEIVSTSHDQFIQNRMKTANLFVKSLGVLALMLTSLVGIKAQTLIAEYPFNGTANASVGTFGPATYTSNGGVLGASSFCTDADDDNSTDGLRTPSISSLSNTNFRIDLRMNLTNMPSVGTNNVALMLGTDTRWFGLMVTNAGKLRIAYNNGSLSGLSSNTLATNTDYDIQIDYNNGVTVLKVDNVVVLTQTLPTLIGGNKIASVGEQYSAGAGPVEGCFSNLKFYNSTAPSTPTAPTISSFTPLNADVGSSVTITGSNFSTAASSNKVYFGGVAATVTSASATSLTVTVPACSQYKKIRVVNLDNNTQVTSATPFLVTNSTLTGANPTFSTIETTSFQSGVHSWTQDDYNKDLIVVDLDNDGKPDVIKQEGNTIKVNRNATTVGTITSTSFGNFIGFSHSGVNINDLEFADINNDGKQDIVVVSNYLAVFLNNSTGAGNISFSSPIEYWLGGVTARRILLDDLNGDGFLDFIYSAPSNSANATTVYVRRNDFGTISSTLSTSVTTTAHKFFETADVNADGKPDLLVSSITDATNGVSVYVNSSTAGTISFAAASTVTTTANRSLSVVDIDLDGDVDFFAIPGSLVNQKVNKLYNASGTLTANEGSNNEYNQSTGKTLLYTGNIDGDDNVDAIAVVFPTSGYACTQYSLYRSYNSSTYDFDNAQVVNIPTNNTAHSVIVDMDGDNKPDIVNARGFYSSFVVMKNTTPTTSVTATPTSLPGFATCFGTASSHQTTSVSGTGLTADMDLTAPTGYEISTDNVTYSNTLTLTQSGGTVAATTIYVRLSASAAAGSPSGNLTITSTGATTQNVALSGTVNALPTVAINNPASVCTPSTVDLTNSAVTVGSTAGLTFTYWTDASATSAIADPTAVATAGTYYIKGEDANGCFAIEPVTVTVNAPITAVSLTLGDRPCGATATGSAIVNITGGTAVTYSWTRNGVAYAATPDTLPTNLTAANSPGYVVTVTDACGNSISSTALVMTNAATISISGTPAQNATILCNGAATASITGIIQGGSSPRTFQVTHTGTSQTYSSSAPTGSPAAGQFSFEVTGLPAGTYSVQVFDGVSSCIVNGSSNITISEPSVITATTTIAGACFGQSNGSVTVAASGGTGAYTYSIDGSTFQAPTTFTGLAAGTYTLYVKDANNCVVTTSATVTQGTALSVSTSAVTNVSCNAGTNGSFTVAGAGGQSPYTYSINGTTFQSATSFTSLAAASYTITVKDASNCTATTTQAITQPAAVVASGTQVNNTCNGATSGSIDLTVVGGSGTYTYLWSNNETTQDLSSLAAGTYTVTIAESNGCTVTGTTSYTITAPAAVVASGTQVNNTCNGATSGSIDLTVTGGSGSYTYSWSDGTNVVGTTQDLSSLAAGTYTVTITESNACTVTGTTSYTITAPTAVVASGTQVNNTCNGGTIGSIDLTVAGGSGTYTYSWSNGTSVVGTTQDLSSLAAGTYTVTITESNGCTATGTISYTITAPAAVVASGTQVNNTCNGATSGSIDLTVVGGSGTYTYLWSNNETTQDLSSLAAGTYTVTIAESNGCTVTGTTSYTITAPAAVVASGTQVNNTCNGGTSGSIDLTVTGGSGNYTYSWSDGTNVVGTTQDLSSLAAGTYAVTITESNACTVTGTTSYTIIAPAVLSATVAPTNVTVCFGNNNGAIVVSSPQGGAGTYEYSIDGGTTWQATGTFSNLVAATYQVVIRDAVNTACTIDLDASGTVISQPTILSATVTLTDVTLCNGNTNGAIDLTAAAGGSGTYEYTIDNGTTWASTASFGSLGAGTYQVAIRDAANTSCVIDLDGSNGTVLTQPTAITATVATTNVTICNSNNNGSITVTSATGGTGTYQYSIDGGTTWQTSNSFNGLTAGNYNVQIRDVQVAGSFGQYAVNDPWNSSYWQSFTATTTGSLYSIQANYYSQASFNLNASVSATLKIFSGNGTGGTLLATQAVNINQPLGVVTPNIFTLTTPINLTAGTQYTFQLIGSSAIGVILSNFNNNYPYSGGQYSGGSNWDAYFKLNTLPSSPCIVDLDGGNGTEITEPVLLSATVSSASATCNGTSTGSITISAAAGGSGTYEYSIDGTNWQSTTSFTGLAAGTYQVSIRDAANITCVIDLDGQNGTDVNEPTVLSVADNGITDAFCANSADGAIDIDVTGGTPGNNPSYTYSWTGANNFTSTTEDQSFNLAPGTYAVTVTDANGCTATLSNLVVSSNPAIVIQLTGTDVTCNSAADGQISTTVTGGGLPYSYTWTGPNGFTSPSDNPFGLNPGDYFVTVTDGNFCTEVSDTITLTEPAAFTAAVSAVSTSICSGLNAEFALTGTAGHVITYTINGGSNQTATVGVGGSVTVTVNNATVDQILTFVSVSDGTCSNPVTGTATVSILALPIANAGNDQTVCTGSDVTLNSTSTNTISWNNSVTNNTAFTVTNNTNAPVTTTYTLTITDANGCVNTDQVDVTVDPAAVANAGADDVICASTSTYTLSGSISGAASSLTWTTLGTGSFSNTSSATAVYTPSAADATSGSVTLILTSDDPAGPCTAVSDTMVLTINPIAVASAGSDASICTGQPYVLAGSISGGATSLTWTTSGTGTFSDANLATSTYTASVADLAAGTVTLTLTTNDPSGPCVAVSDDMVVTISLTPTVVSESDVTLCTGTASSAVTFTGNDNSTTYTWSNDNTATGLVASGTISLPIFTGVNATTSALTSTVVVIPTLGTCTGIADTIIYTVQPLPTVDQQSDITYCGGVQQSPITFTGSTSNTQYSWTSTQHVGFLSSGIANPSIGGYYIDPTSQVVSTVVVTPQISGGGLTCSGSNMTFTVTVNPTPDVNAVSNQVLCNGDSTVAINFSGNIPAGLSLIAYEGFDYPINTNIANQSGGFGWASNWVGNYYGGSSMYVKSPGLTYTGVTTEGNRLEWDGPGQYEPHAVKRSIDNPNSGIVYVQFISDFNSTSGGTDRVDFKLNGATQAYVGGNNPQGEMSIMAGGLTINSGYSVFDPSLVIIQIDYDNQTTKMWVNPTMSGFDYNNPGTPDAVYNNSVAFDEIELVFRAGAQIDELTVYGGATYNWTNDNLATGLAASGIGNIPSFGSTNTSSAPIVSNITVTPTLNGCTGTPITTTITVNPTPTVTDPTDQTLCAGDSTTEVIFTGAAAGTLYSWSNNNTTTGLAASGYGPVPAFTALNSGSTAVTSTVTVTPTYIPTAGVYHASVSEGQSISYTAPSGMIITGVSFASYGDPSGVGPFTVGSNNAANSVSLIEQTALGQNTFSITASDANFPNSFGGTQTLAVTLTYGDSTLGCPGATETYSYTVNPVPVYSNQSEAVCSGSALSVTPTGTVVPSGTQFTWTHVDNASVTGEANNTTAASTFAATLTNTTNTAQNVVYTLTPSSGACSGSTFDFTVVLDPVPSIANIVDTICSGSTFTVTPANGSGNIVPAGTTYTWSAPSVTGITGTLSGSSAANISGTLVNTTNAPIDVTYTVTPQSSTPAPAIGSNYGGGQVGYILQPNDPGYVAGQITMLIVKQISNNALWGCQGNYIAGANGTAIGTGQANTNAIIAACNTAGIAAELCDSYSSGGYSDWYLPSRDELETMFFTYGNIGLSSGEYWTSSDFSANNSYYVYFPAQIWALNRPKDNPGTPISVIAMRTETIPSTICAGTSFDVTVTVNPMPSIANTTATTCGGTPFTVTPTNGGGDIVPANTTYSWTFVDEANVTGEAIGTDQADITQTLTNASTSAQQVVYTVTPTSGTCVGSNFTIIATINTTPIVADKVETICSGTAFTVSPSNTAPDVIPNGTQYSWTVSPNANITGASNVSTAQNNISQTLTNTSNTVQTITYTVLPLLSGCNGETFDIVVTVNPTPVVNNDSIIACSGVEFVYAPIHGSNNNVIPNGTTYTWSVIDNPLVLGESAQGSGQSSIVQTLVNTGLTTGTVSYTVTPLFGGCSGNNFTLSVSIQSLDVAALTGSTTLCSGSTAQLASATAGGVWTSSNASVATVNSSTGIVTGVSLGSAIITYTVTDANGCIGSASAAVNVISAPTATITANGSTTLCAGSSLTLTASAGTGYTYQWSNNTNNQDAIVTASGSYSVTVTDANGCSVTSSPIVITVTPLPTIAGITGSTDVCEGGSSQLASATAGGTWTSSNSSVASISSSGLISGVSAGSALITYTATVGGCTNSTTTTVIVNTLPTATISTIGSTTICLGGFVNMVGPSAPAGIAYSYVWNLNGTAISGATSSSYTATTAGVYTLTVTNNSGCTTLSPAVTVVQNELDWANIQSPALDTICEGGTIDIFGQVFEAGITPGAGQGSGITAQFGYSTQNSDPSTWTNWLNASFNAEAGNNDEFVGTITGLTAGTYYFAFRYSLNGCTYQYGGYSSNGGGFWDGSSNTNGVLAVIAAPSLSAISGANFVCSGNSSQLSNSTSGGTWSSSNTAVASISSNGLVTGLTAGSTVITYSYTNSVGCSSSVDLLLNVSNGVASTITVGGPTTFCSGGSVSLTASTGASYLWSNGAQTQSISVTTSGSYYVTVTNGCSSTSTAVSVNVNPLPTVAAITGATNVCSGSTTQLASATTGGTWTSSNTAVATVSTTGVVTGVTAGTAIITYEVTDVNGCSNSVTASVNVNAGTTATIAAGGATTFCSGGSVTLTANSGSGYLWSNGAQTQSITVTNGGSYYVTVTNASGCSATSAATAVTVNALPTVNILANGPLTFCQGGSVTLSASPVVAGDIYLWSNGATTPSVNLTASATMTVSITSASGCTTTSMPVAVNVFANPTATISVGGATTFCAGGSVTLTANAGIGYTYQWSNNTNNQTAIITASGSYTVTVTDANGCSISSAPTNVTVNPLPTVAAITGTTNICSASTTQLTSSTLGGNWSSSNTSIATISSSGLVSGLSAGTTTITYSVTDANGCSNAVTTIVNISNAPTATVTTIGSTTICQGGFVNLVGPAASSGDSFTYVWNLNGTAISGATSSSYSATSPGSYTLVVTNNTGCVSTSIATVVSQSQLDWANVQSPGVDTICEGGSIAIFGQVFESGITPAAGQGSGITAQFGYSTQNSDPSTWTNWLNASFNGQSGNNDEFVGTLSGLTAGTYYFAFRYSLNGCTYQYGGYNTSGGGFWDGTSNNNGLLVVVGAPSLSAIGGPNVVCVGNTAQLTNSITGGIWSTSNPSVASISNSGVITGLTAGSTIIGYTYTNSVGCISSVSGLVNVNGGGASTITAGGPTTFCAGNSVTLTASTGTSYLWSNGAQTQSITVTDGGSYYVTVTNGCASTSPTTFVTVSPLPTANILSSGPLTFCQGGSVTLSVSQSNTGDSYFWSTNEITPSIDVTTSSTVTLTVTNAAGCSVTSLPVSVNVFTSPSATITPLSSTTICEGSSVSLQANSGLGYSYQWSNGMNNQIISVVNGGFYTVTITDANGCTVASTATQVVVNPLPSGLITANGPTTFCQGGSVELIAPFAASYLWSNGATTSSIIVSSAGTYDVLITDANGCSATLTPIAVTVNALPNATIVSTGSNVCLGSTVTLSATGGVSYQWSNGATNQAINVVSSNNYSVVVTDANGCENTASENVVFNANPVVTITANGPTVFCQGGSLTLTATGGVNYVWNNGDQGATTTVNQSGAYFVTVTNASGCTTQSSTVNVTVNAAPVVAAISGNNAVCEGGNISLTSATIGGIWTSANNFIATIDGAGNVTGLNAGSTIVTYTVTANGCSSSVFAQVNVLNSPITPTITASGSTSVCPGGSVVLFASNAASYQWSNGPQTPFIVVTQSGDYTVISTGLNGCSATSLPISVFIGDNTLPVITAPLNVTVTPNLGCEAIGVALGTPVTSDNCSVTSVTNDAPAIFPIGTTTVTWTVTDASGNIATATQLVNVIDQSAPVATAPANITLGSNNFCEATGVDLGMPNATDNCTNNLTITNNAPATYPLGITVVTWTITDAAGNITTVDQTVTVVDQIAPVVLLANTAVILDANGAATISFADLDNGSIDNCGIATVVLSQTEFDCSNVGNNLVGVTITDNSGNQTTAQVIVTVIASDACGDSNTAGPIVPDAFTPNGNNFNDTWVIPGLEGYNTKEMTVYSRYGTLVYYSSQYNNDWDGMLLNSGSPVPDGTYYYVLNLDGGKQLNGYVYINRVKQ